MEDFDPPLSMSGLFCHENESCFNEHYDHVEILQPCSISEPDDEYINILFQKEDAIFVSNSSIENDDQSWFKCARSDAIQWILNTRAFFGFHFRTAYLSLLYFDQFFSKRSIDVGKLWAVRLLSVACLSLAAKMEECRVPALSEYHVDEYNFEGNVVQRMELLVLSTLEWKMNLITPFAYLHYFINKFCGENRPKELVSRSIDLIIAIVREIKLVEHRPSIIAAAAVLAAYDYQLTRKILEFKMSVISSWGSLEKENILSCYSLLQEKEMLRSKTPNSFISPKILVTSCHVSKISGNDHVSKLYQEECESRGRDIISSCTDILENSSITSAIGTKRRLEYNDCDQHCPPPKLHRS